MARPGSPAAHSNCIMRKFQEYLWSIRRRGKDRMGTAASYLLLCLFTDCIHYIHTSILHIWILAAPGRRPPPPNLRLLQKHQDFRVCLAFKLDHLDSEKYCCAACLKMKTEQHLEVIFSFKSNYICASQVHTSNDKSLYYLTFLKESSDPSPPLQRPILFEKESTIKNVLKNPQARFTDEERSIVPCRRRAVSTKDKLTLLRWHKLAK